MKISKLSVNVRQILYFVRDGNCNTITADAVLMRTDTDQPIMDIIGFNYDKNSLTTGHTNVCKNEDTKSKLIILQFANKQNLYNHK